MKKRSLLALAMVGALSVSMLAGCGSSSTKETQAPAGSEAATEAATEAAKESTAAGDGKVYYLNFKPEQDAQWQELAKLYTEETGVPVTVLTAASGNYETTLKSEMAKTDAPTLFQVNGPVGLASWKDYCYDLKDSKIAGELTNDEFALMDGDSMAGIGYVIETYGIIYNKALLEKAGYTQDDIKSFDDLKKVAEDITARKDELGFSAFTSAGMDGSSDWRSRHILQIFQSTMNTKQTTSIQQMPSKVHTLTTIEISGIFTSTTQHVIRPFFPQRQVMMQLLNS